MTRTIAMDLAGENLVVRGDRTLFWPAQAALFVADLHLGKGAAFRSEGVPIPTGSTGETLRRLHKATEETNAAKLVVLGDLWHARSGRTAENRKLLSQWRAEHPLLSILLVIGNHDRGAGWELDAVEEGHQVGPFVLRHHPEPSSDGYVLCGHLHPGHRLEGRGGQSLRLPCFWFGQEVGVLPAFGDLTGHVEVRAVPSDHIYVTAEGLVTKVPILDRFSTRRR